MDQWLEQWSDLFQLDSGSNKKYDEDILPDGDGEGNRQQSDSDISHGQRQDKEVGDALQVGVEADGPADQDVPGNSQKTDEQLQANVDHLVVLQHSYSFELSSHSFMCF